MAKLKKINKKKFVYGFIWGIIVFIVLFFSFHLWQAKQSGELYRYVIQKTAPKLAQTQDEDIMIVSTKDGGKSNQNLYDGYYGRKYSKDGKNEEGTFYFNGNFEAAEKKVDVSLWDILFR